MKKVLGIGNALVDIMTLMDDDSFLQQYSLPKGSMQMVDSEKSALINTGTCKLGKVITSGGSAANTMHGLGMLGVETGFIGSTGADPMGDFFEKEMRNAGITTKIFRRNIPTGTATTLISPDSERTFATCLGAASELYPADLDNTFFSRYNILYLEGYLIFNLRLVEKACMLAKTLNMEVALDLASYNVVEAKLDDFRNIAYKYVDILIANSEEAKAFTGCNGVEALNEMSRMSPVAVVKNGREGSVIKSGGEIMHIEAAAASVCDTTGAGDLYAAGFLYGYSLNCPLGFCGKIGSLLAGKVIEITGARLPAEIWNEVKPDIMKITGLHGK
ncbi:MAG: adenosine kinase [Bacteroidales bacterium]|jgi:sugar/nucleoside kinase (ribokinase family)|nr:adenosine kinase [Bacteroidales bacterium]